MISILHLTLFSLLSLRATALWIPFFSALAPAAVPEDSLQQYKDSIMRSEAYQSLPWVELVANYSFSPRDFPRPMPFEVHEEYYKAMPTKTIGWWLWNTKPTRTRSEPQKQRNIKALLPRSTFTFSCPTSVQCNNGGCCPVGDYCAIKEGQLGCCPIGSNCDAGAIPGCSTSCYGICCDLINTIIGEAICSPTPGDGGQASGICTGVEPTSPLATQAAVCTADNFICGQECCPNNAGLVCDNVTIPGVSFCNQAADVCAPGMRKRDSNDTCLNVTTNSTAFSTRFQAQASLAVNSTITMAPNGTAMVSSTAGSTAMTTGGAGGGAITSGQSSSATAQASSATSMSSVATATTTKASAARGTPQLRLDIIFFVLAIFVIAW